MTVQIVMGALVLAAGLYVLLIADASADVRIFGGVIALVGALGIAAAVLVRRRTRGPGR